MCFDWTNLRGSMLTITQRTPSGRFIRDCQLFFMQTKKGYRLLTIFWPFLTHGHLWSFIESPIIPTWLVVWLPFFIFPCIGNHHPNWLILFRGVQTTNQNIIYQKSFLWENLRLNLSWISYIWGKFLCVLDRSTGWQYDDFTNSLVYITYHDRIW